MIRVVAAALVRGGRVLVARRAAWQRNPGRWELPGGKVEEGESDAEALVRELREELGVAIAVEEWIAETEHEDAWGPIGLVALRARLLHGEPTPLEHAELRWVTPAELRALDLSPADRPLVEPVVRALLER